MVASIPMRATFFDKFMQKELFNKKKDKCDACKESTCEEEVLEKIIINGSEFFFCSDCIIGQQSATAEENEEFIRCKKKN
jgi:hypothetical protein